MKKEKNTASNFVLPGVTNYDKLKQNKKTAKIYSFNPFQQENTDKVKQNIEAEPSDARYLPDEIYSQMLLQKMSESTYTKRGQSAKFFSLEPYTKRKRLQSMSSYDMLDEVLTKITDEIIVDGTQSEYPITIDIDRIALEKNKLKADFIDKFEKRANDIFNTMYNLYGFRDTGSTYSLWNTVYEFLIEGKRAYTIVYDDPEKPKNIIAIVEIDPLDLEYFHKDGKKYWIHRKKLANDRQNKIVLYDNQVIFIDWSDSKANARFSYLEQLVRSFNNTRIIDETRLIWSITNAMFRSVFNIPTGGLSRIKAATTVATEMQRYHDDINYDSDTGELFTNGNPNMKFFKEYWFADGDQGTPEVSTVGGDGPDLNDSDMNDYFNRKFYRNSRVPYSRFDATASETWNLDARSQLREEITFGRFINRIRQILNPLFLKPVLIQLAMEFPEIKDDSNILNAVKIRYESYSIFEELLQLNVLQEKIQFIEQMREALVRRDADGDDIPFFSMKWLVEKYLPEIDEEDIKLNKKYMEKENENMFEIMKKKAELTKEIDEIRGDTF